MVREARKSRTQVSEGTGGHAIHAWHRLERELGEEKLVNTKRSSDLAHAQEKLGDLAADNQRLKFQVHWRRCLWTQDEIPSVVLTVVCFASELSFFRAAFRRMNANPVPSLARRPSPSEMT